MKSIRILILVSWTALILGAGLWTGCSENGPGDSTKQSAVTLAALTATPAPSVPPTDTRTKCEKLGGFCTDLNHSCGESHVGWVPYGCPNPNEEGVCCLPMNSCSAIGGICKLKTESCASGQGGTVFMDCPQGAAGQCCIPFE